ncbi:MAG: hypothetical protein QMD92_01270 [bacterium]|nr:hypothetical protein [bacterium]
MDKKKIIIGLILILVAFKIKAGEPEIDVYKVKGADSSGINIECRITEKDGIYDTIEKYDGVSTKPKDKSVYIKWDLDGELEKDAMYTSMSLKGKKDKDVFISDYPLKIKDKAKKISLVYKVYAYSKKKDKQGESSFYAIIKVVSIGEIRENKKNIEMVVVVKKTKDNNFVFDQNISYREF